MASSSTWRRGTTCTCTNIKNLEPFGIAILSTPNIAKSWSTSWHWRHLGVFFYHYKTVLLLFLLENWIFSLVITPTNMTKPLPEFHCIFFRKLWYGTIFTRISFGSCSIHVSELLIFSSITPLMNLFYKGHFTIHTDRTPTRPIYTILTDRTTKLYKPPGWVGIRYKHETAQINYKQTVTDSRSLASQYGR